jgi:hypothetical protein
VHTTVLTASPLAVLDGLTAIAPVREFDLAGGTIAAQALDPRVPDSPLTRGRMNDLSVT